MPIVLPPISRRNFMAGSAAASLGLLLSRRALAAGEPDTNRFFLISDTHIAAKPETMKSNVNMTNNLKQVCGELLEARAKPAAVIHCGDCAYLTGEADDYAAFTALLKRPKSHDFGYGEISGGVHTILPRHCGLSHFFHWHCNKLLEQLARIRII